MSVSTAITIMVIGLLLLMGTFTVVFVVFTIKLNREDWIQDITKDSERINND